jgi:hypothetical protein
MSDDNDHGPDCNCKEVEAAVENLKQAVQQYANAVNSTPDIPVFVAESVVVYETMRMNPDGSDGRSIQWTIPSDHWSLATAVGLLDMGMGYIKADLIKVRVEREDD